MYEQYLRLVWEASHPLAFRCLHPTLLRFVSMQITEYLPG